MCESYTFESSETVGGRLVLHFTHDQRRYGVSVHKKLGKWRYRANDVVLTKQADGALLRKIEEAMASQVPA